MSKVKIQGNASGTGVLTVTAPNTSTDRTITLPDSTDTLAVNSDVTNKLPLAGGTMTGHLLLNDSVNIKMGAGADFKLSHDGNNSYIEDAGTGALRILSSQTEFKNTADSTIFTRIDSDGIKFGSDTAAVNALDDYETGTWTPSNQWISLTNHVTARYVKIGNVVMVWGNVQWASSPSDVSQTGGKIQGLPFTPLGGDHPWEGSWWINHTTGARKGITETDFYVNASTELIMYNRVNSRILQRQQVSGTHLKFQAIYQVA